MFGSKSVFSVLFIAYSLVLYLVFWFSPLLILNSLETKYQDPVFSDQNFYLYYASYFCSFPPDSLSGYNVTWSAQGVVYYLTGLCNVFGSVYVHSLINLILFLLVLFSALHAVANQTNQSVKLRLIYILAFPSTFLSLTLPGKEVFSISAFVCIAAALCLFPHSRLKSVLWVLLGVSISAFSRPHEAVVFLGIFFLYVGYRKLGLLFLLLMVLLGGIVSELVLTLVINPLMGIELTSISDQVVVTSEGVGRYLVSSNIVVHLLLSPLRAIYLYCGVMYTSVQLFYVNLDWYALYRDIPLALRVVDFGAGLYLLYEMRRLRCQAAPPAIFAISMYVMVITLFGVEEKSRYLYPIFPVLLFAMSLVQRRDNN